MSELTKALIKAKANFKPIKKTAKVEVTMKSGAKYTFKYAPMEELKDATEKPLADEGLVVMFTRDGDTLVTSLLHISGEEKQSRSNMRIPATASQQEEGSIRTYQERYNYAGILGLTISDDDDGNIADGNHYSRNNSAKTAPKPTKQVDAPKASTKQALSKADVDWYQTMDGCKQSLGEKMYRDILGSEGYTSSKEITDSPRRRAIYKRMKQQITEDAKAKLEGAE